MKKYIQPQMEVTEIKMAGHLLAGSTTLGLKSTPIDNGQALAPSLDDLLDDEDDY